MAGSENGNFFIVPNALIDDERLTRIEIVVLFSLLRHYNKEQKRAWPSIDLIAKEARTSRFWTIETLKKLEQEGYIRTEKKAGQATRYSIITSQFSLPVNTVDQSTHLTEPVNSVDLYPSTQLTKAVNSVDPNNTIEQYKKNKTIEQEGRLLSPDPWIRDRLSEICQVVNSPKPANLDLLIGQWRETYGESTVEQTIPRALRWMQDNAKKYTDMGRFIGNWLARDAARPRAKTQERVDYGDALPSWKDLLGGRQ